MPITIVTDNNAKKPSVQQIEANLKIYQVRGEEMWETCRLSLFVAGYSKYKKISIKKNTEGLMFKT